MKRILFLISIPVLFMILGTDSYPEILVKIRDIAYIDGLKENQVFGFGLVVGLQGTGDSSSSLAETSLKSLLKNIGIIEEEKYKTKNIACVLLTAGIPGYARLGDRLDVDVSSIGDAKSLEGGILIQSPLMGADTQIYLVCQGPLSFAGPKSGTRRIKTTAKVINGGLVERAVEPDIIMNNSIGLVLKDWNFTLADNIIKAVSAKYKESLPEITVDGKIKIIIPQDINLAEFISSIENIEVNPNIEARVVVNERDGTIVMGGNVRISELVVSRDGMTIKIEKTGEKASAAEFKESSSVKDIVDSLNYIGASTQDIISILKAIKEAGALHGKLIIN